MLDSQSMQLPQHVFDPSFDAQWEHLTVYFLWRYFLKASVDGQVLSQTESCLFHVLCIAALFSCQDAQDLQIGLVESVHGIKFFPEPFFGGLSTVIFCVRV